MTLIFAIITALWNGILTSISPCPLTTNIAAISFISRKTGHRREAILSGLLYTVGRSLAYVIVGAIVLRGALEASELSFALQKFMNKLLGPILIVTGMFLLQMISFNIGRGRLASWAQKQAEKRGAASASLILGFIFALTFCPVSVFYFFGTMIAVMRQADSWLLLPTLYGIGTAVPVLIFSMLVVLASERLGKAFDTIKLVELWARRITGTIFIIAGVYCCVSFNF